MTPEVTERPAETEFQKWDKAPDEETSSAAAPAKAETETAKPAPAPEPDKDTQDPDEEKLPKGLKKRFRELTSEIRELKTKLAPPAAEPARASEPVKTEPAAGGDKEPDANDFKTYEAYNKALVLWNVRQARLEDERKVTEQRAKEDATKAAESWKTELEAARTRHDDFDEVALSDMPINQATHDAITSGGRDGAELAYYLGSHRDEAAAILKLSPLQTTLALGKILAKLDASKDDSETPKPLVTRAPRPPKTVTGSGGADLGKEPDPKDFKAWNKWKDRQEAQDD